MTTLFKGATNGGANRVFFKNDDLLIAGQAVGGRQSLDAELIAKVWGGDLTETATLKAGASLNDINDATISVKASGGAAFVYAQLADVGSYFGNFGPGQNGGREADAGAIGSKFTDLDRALDGARLQQDADGNWEITISGGGVGGRVSTNGDFATEADAQAFLDTLVAEADAPDAYSVHVEDDDLDGAFVFEFSGWYRDVNARKIEAKLADSDVVTDGSIDSRAEGAAANHALFLEQMANSGDKAVLEALEDVGTGLGNVGQVENGVAGPASAEDIGAKFTGGVENALTRAQIREEADGEFELFFSGNGVGGQVTTNGNFASAEDAEAFRTELLGLQPGFLDDALF